MLHNEIALLYHRLRIPLPSKPRMIWLREPHLSIYPILTAKLIVSLPVKTGTNIVITTDPPTSPTKSIIDNDRRKFYSKLHFARSKLSIQHDESVCGRNCIPARQVPKTDDSARP